MPQFTAADTIRILIATDSHIGYCERDPIRKDDSWKSFDEAMQLAKAEDVDMVLLAGDLFHDNRPSRKSMYQCMRSLRQNCLGEKPCELELLSDASTIFDGAFNNVNYEDPDINVAIPVFSIHGNHDDPTGDGHYCALDLLQVSGLLNYFGRVTQADRLDIRPVLLQKGRTKLALYGMSNVRDERLFRTFRDGNVKFYKPTVQQDDWFNLMAVHQNHHAHTETGYLPENFLPEFLDLVVWGHEHECLMEPRKNIEMMFDVIQPGSSVATSLCAGEAVAKHVAILKITGTQYEVEKKIRLKTVRPFIMKEMVLAQEPRFKDIAKQKENRSTLTVELKKIVEGLIEEAKQEWRDVQGSNAVDEDDESALVEPLPLVRLRVEYSAPPDGGKFDIENPQRFSNRFVNQVANVNDVVQFYRKKTLAKKEKEAKAVTDETLFSSVSLDSVKVGTLVQEYLSAQSLKIIPQAPFSEAITMFIDKDDKSAITQFLDASLSTQVKGLLGMEVEDDEVDKDTDDLDVAMEQIRERAEKAFAAGERPATTKRRMKARPLNWDSDLNGDWESYPGAYEALDGETAAGKKDREDNTRRRGLVSLDVSDDDGNQGRVTTTSKTNTSTTTRKAPAKKAAPARKPAPKAKAAPKAPTRSRKAVPEPSDDEDDDVIMLDDDFEEITAPAPKTRAKPAAKGATSKPPARAAASRGARQTQTQLSFFSQSQSQDPSRLATSGRRAPASSASVAPRELSHDAISDDDDDDDAFEPMVTGSRRR